MLFAQTLLLRILHLAGENRIVDHSRDQSSRYICTAIFLCKDSVPGIKIETMLKNRSG